MDGRIDLKNRTLKNGSLTNTVPRRDGGVFLTDAGIETTLIYQHGLELPYFAAFHLLRDTAGTEALRRYFRVHAAIARAHGVGFVLESATWRASGDWGEKLGYSPGALANVNRQAIQMLHDIRAEMETERSPMPISGCVGPRGDGYRPDALMLPDVARTYHARQIDVFAEAGVDMVTAITMTNVDEATGVTLAAQDAGLPVVISFTVETDARLPSGETLAGAIAAVDEATGGGPAYYMINCAHPTHFARELAAGGNWVARLGGIRANASARSHAELDAATELDAGDPVTLAAQYADLRARYPHITVLGGCCGTDHRHIAEIAAACAAPIGAGSK